jgi:hypothetical protein
VIPLISIVGVFLSKYISQKRSIWNSSTADNVKPNWVILLGSLAFVVISVIVGSLDLPFAQEIVFVSSMSIILFLMYRLLPFLPESKRLMIVGTAISIFAFRAVPLPGPGLTWFEIDELLFDEQFLSILSVVASGFTLLGIIFLRPLVSQYSIAKVIIVLSLLGGVLFLPTVGLYYGVHHFTVQATQGLVDARFIAIFNTALESPLGQVAMIPLLAWIAKNAPMELKATFFAVFASFTNLALSASALGSKYINQIFEVSREVRDSETQQIVTTSDYSELGLLLMTVLVITTALPILTIIVIQKSRFRSDD